MAGDPTWDFLDPTSRGRLLSVLRTEIDAMLELAAPASRWHVPTACPGWELRDMVGHLVDATESDLSGFDLARRGVAGEEPIGVAGMAKASDAAARSFRNVPQDELVQRLRVQSDRLLYEFESL
ncbi:MAG TPA: maleylpyruvate isomerase N-terminal domain-containing protein, partial [Acidimicrobiales bacterium]